MPVSAGFLPSAALNSPAGVGPAPPVRKLRGSVKGVGGLGLFLARVLCSRLVGLRLMAVAAGPSPSVE